MEHEFFMEKALELAQKSMEEGEVPVGCVIVKSGRIIGRGRKGARLRKRAFSRGD
jgi:tRNA(adenine34) deaminase